MTPEREAIIRAYANNPHRDPWSAMTYLDEVLEALDAERARVAKLKKAAMAVMGDSVEWECDCAVCDLMREELAR